MIIGNSVSRMGPYPTTTVNLFSHNDLPISVSLHPAVKALVGTILMLITAANFGGPGGSRLAFVHVDGISQLTGRGLYPGYNPPWSRYSSVLFQPRISRQLEHAVQGQHTTSSGRVSEVGYDRLLRTTQTRSCIRLVRFI
jgi:hypothetical protein